MTALSIPQVPIPATIGLHRRLARISDAAGHIRTMAIDHPENYLKLFDADLATVEFSEVVESKLDMIRVLAQHSTSVLIDPVWSFGQAIAAARVEQTARACSHSADGSRCPGMRGDTRREAPAMVIPLPS